MDIQELTSEFLRASKWSQDKLAETIGVHTTSLNRYLRHRRRQSTGEKLAEFLLKQAGTQISFDSQDFQKA